MQCPSDGWSETESGFEKGDKTIVVRQVRFGGPRGLYSGYSIQIWKGSAGYSTVTDVATYKKADKAKELAILLTRLYEVDPEVQMTITRFDNTNPPGPETREPIELMRDILGHESYLVDEALDWE